MKFNLMGVLTYYNVSKANIARFRGTKQEIQADKLEYETDPEKQKLYFRYVMLRTKGVETLINIISKLREIDCFYDLTMGSGKVVEVVHAAFPRLHIVGYEQNPTRYKLLKAKYPQSTIRRKFTNEYMDFGRSIVTIDPPWGGWDILKGDRSLIGFIKGLTIGQLLNCLKAPYFILNLPRNYYLKDITNHVKKIEVYETGKSAMMILATK